MKKDSLRLVQHNFQGQVPLFELQFLSLSKVWYALDCKRKLSDIKEFCVKYNLIMPESIIQCNDHNHKDFIK